MNIEGISEQAWTPYRPNLDGSFNERFQHFRAFRTALQSGNLADAKGAFSAFQKDVQNGLRNLASDGTKLQHEQATKDLQSLGDALDSGDIATARQSFAALKRDLQGVHAQHVHQQGRAGEAAAGESAPAPQPGPGTSGTILNVFA